MGHPEFRTTGWKGVSTGAGAWNVDGYGHGTHVTGTIAARNDGQGVVGVAPKATIVTIRVFNSDGDWAYASSVAKAALTCHQRGAKVINMSIGGGDYSAAERDTFKNLLAQGVVSVAGKLLLKANRRSRPAVVPVLLGFCSLDSVFSGRKRWDHSVQLSCIVRIDCVCGRHQRQQTASQLFPAKQPRRLSRPWCGRSKYGSASTKAEPIRLLLGNFDGNPARGRGGGTVILQECVRHSHFGRKCHDSFGCEPWGRWIR